MKDERFRDVVLVILGGLVLAWLLFRKRIAAVDAPGNVAVSLPPVQDFPPDYLTYNVPAGSKTLLPSISPVSLPSLTLASPQNPPANSQPTCGCSGGAGSGQLFSSVNQMVSSFASQVSGIEGKYLASIMNAFPQAAITAANA